MRAAIGYRHPWREELLTGSQGPDVLEVVADHFFAHPAGVEALAERYPILLHDVGCSIATGGPDPARLARLRDVARRARALVFSDHLAMTRSPGGIDVGHLCPFRYDRSALRTLIEGVSRLQDALAIPVAIENISTPFDVPGGDLTEAELWHGLVEGTGCEMLLDLTNVSLDARNAQVDPWDRIRDLPLSAVRWVHLSGGRATRSGWVDSHSAPVDEPSYALLRRLRGCASLQGVIVERDSHLPALEEIVGEARRAVAVWEER